MARVNELFLLLHSKLKPSFMYIILYSEFHSELGSRQLFNIATSDNATAGRDKTKKLLTTCLARQYDKGQFVGFQNL